MQITQLFDSDDERAVSPVIGVILMVAITVILAAVIGTFVLGLGDQVQQTSPNAQWDWSGSADDVDLTQEGGDTVSVDRIEVTGTAGGPYCDATSDWDGLNSESEITAGATCADLTGGTDESGNTLRLIWTAEGGGSSSTLSTYEA
jgi:flagellin-like protein